MKPERITDERGLEWVVHKRDLVLANGKFVWQTLRRSVASGMTYIFQEPA